jgi:hypothetical protein
MNTRNSIPDILLRSIITLISILMIAGATFLAACDGDEITDFEPGPPPSWWPGTPYADSVTYLHADSVLLHGHFTSKQKSLSIVSYAFLVHEHGPGIYEYEEYMLAQNTTWTFPDLAVPVISKFRVPAANPDPAVTTEFTLTIEVVNPNYRQGDPIGTRTYYLVSNTVVIERWE